MNKHQRYTHSEVLAQVFVDENNDFDTDVADSLSYSSEQVCKTGRQDSVEITVFRLSSMVKKKKKKKKAKKKKQ